MRLIKRNFRAAKSHMVHLTLTDNFGSYRPTLGSMESIGSMGSNSGVWGGMEAHGTVWAPRFSCLLHVCFVYFVCFGMIWCYDDDFTRK